jgi:hypothetical protein
MEAADAARTERLESADAARNAAAAHKLHANLCTLAPRTLSTR